MFAARKGTIFRLFRDVTTCHAMRFLLGSGVVRWPTPPHHGYRQSGVEVEAGVGHVPREKRAYFVALK
jgi:hypothetical protein